MSTLLPKGGNTSLQTALADSPLLRVIMEWGGEPLKQSSVDVAALLLGENGKMLPGGIVFQADDSAASGAVTRTELEVEMDDRRQGFTIDTSKIPPEVSRVTLALVVQMGGFVRSIGKLNPVNIRVFGGSNGAELCHSNLAPGGNEMALVLGEVYRRNNEWKFKCLGQPFLGGLRAMAESYGMTVAEAAQAEAAPAAPPPAGTTTFSPPLNKGFGEINLTLTWAAEIPPGAVVSQKGLGSLIPGKKGPKTTDLDLCCLYELADGHRGVVQSLGDQLGAYGAAPYIELMGDARKGEGDGAGEVMRLNGARWPEVRRILIYAMIFEGTPNWAASQARLSLRLPDEVPVSMRLEGGDKRVAAAALLENAGGKLVLHKLRESYNNPRELDEAYRWGLKWAAGRKD